MNTNTQIKTFKVPLDLVIDFAGMIADHDLPCELMGVSKKNKIIYDVSYTKEQREAVNELTELMDDYKNNQEEEE